MRKLINYSLITGSLTLLVIFLWWHWQLGMTRYFDVDEFAHLSWAYQMFSGRWPYVDFLFFFPPGFHLFLMPLFTFGSGIAPIIAARLVQFGTFVLLVGTTIVLFWLMRRSWVAILAGVFLAFLPMPFDKFLEIRPDTLATVFVMLGMVVQIGVMGEIGEIRWRKKLLFLSGLFYGLSLLILPKTAPQVGVAVGVALIREIWESKGGKGDRGRKSWFYLLIGLMAPIFFFAIWTLTLGNIDQVIYSLTNLPVEANKISQTFIMMPDLFFYPNATFYGTAGWGIGLIVNHAIWILAIFVGVYRLIAPFLSGVVSPGMKIPTLRPARHVLASSMSEPPSFHKGFLAKAVTMLRNGSLSRVGVSPAAGPAEKVWSELLIAATFFTHVIFYVQIVPLKHTQYLIPIAVFVAFYAADAVDMLWRKVQEISKNHANLLSTGVFLALFFWGSIWLWRVFVAVNTPKLSWTNEETIKQLTAIYQTIPTSEYILDLTGETLYYRHPYVACCMPFGQFAHYLTRPLPPLAEALDRTKTTYIFEGGVKRTDTLLPADQDYIAAHYLPHPTIGGVLVRK